MKKYPKPEPYVAESKDHRLAGTFEVLLPIPGRVKPQRAASQFASKQAAEAWMHSAEGRDTIADLFAEATKPLRAGR
jgi:hypothetical protein